MDGNQMQKRSFLTPMFALVLLSILAISLIWIGYNKMHTSSINPAPTWKNITPGLTTIRDAALILGPANQVENNSSHPTRAFAEFFDTSPEYQVYIYKERINDWKHVELWTKKNHDTEYVVAILLTLREIEPKQPIFLDSFVNEYGRPDEVTWTSFPNSRYIIWSRSGVAVSAEADLATRKNGVLMQLSWNEISVNEILYFEPMVLSQLMKTVWPWPNNGAGWSSGNLYPAGQVDFAGDIPKDPYDWSEVPSY